jgi:WhiB family transcriptional regulator, redox-sensing transcriptional regulator
MIGPVEFENQLTQTAQAAPDPGVHQTGSSTALHTGSYAVQPDDQSSARLTINDEELLRLGDKDWHDRALCAQSDPDAFFPDKGGSTREAKRICHSCDVKGPCLEYALINDERYGIWGGLPERQRRHLKRA